MPSVTVLDIGAGYGRLAYRLAKSLPNLKSVLCADAVAESTFLCEHYLNYRGVSDRAKVVPLDTVEEALPSAIDIVTNIHSFQECTYESISWWLNVISKRKVKYFMLAHYKDELHSRERDGTAKDFRPLLEMKGFKLVSKESVYAPGTLAGTYGLYPERWYYLFINESVESQESVA
jgi:ubiquinone/menaquinone biosynthesis C-methylase UbiE